MSGLGLSLQDLEAASPEGLAEFLAANGWERERISDIADVWRTETASLLLPLDNRVSDFPQRLHDALQILRAVHEDQWLQIVAALGTGRADVLRFRSLVETPPDGSIGFEAGVQFVEAVRKVIVAAAKASTDSKSGHYANRNHAVADRYLTTARLGQTERGSFIVTVISRLPAAPEVDESEIFQEPPPEPMQRTVNVQLMRALDAAVRAATTFAETSDFAAFEQSVAQGVSAELCDAAIGLLSQGSDVELTVTPSADVPIARDVPMLVVLRSENLPALNTARREFRTEAPESNVRLSGIVERLNRTEQRGPGTIGFRILDGTESANKARVRLEAEDYDKAIQAHREGRIVRVTGSLEREGNLFWLYESTNFVVGEIFVPPEPGVSSTSPSPGSGQESFEL